MIRLTKKQKLFAHYYLMNGGNAYQAAINAGYAKSVAKNARKNILDKRGFRRYLASLDNTDAERKWVDKQIEANLYRIASGQSKKSHYILHDLKHPEESTDQIMIGPSATREQVSSIDLYLKLRGLEYSSSKELEQAKSAKERAEANVNQVKAKSASKIYHLKLILAKAKIRKTKAEAKIKELLAKQNNTKNNQTISKVDELLDAIFDDKK